MPKGVPARLVRPMLELNTDITKTCRVHLFLRRKGGVLVFTCDRAYRFVAQTFSYQLFHLANAKGFAEPVGARPFEKGARIIADGVPSDENDAMSEIGIAIEDGFIQFFAVHLRHAQVGNNQVVSVRDRKSTRLNSS